MASTNDATANVNRGPEILAACGTLITLAAVVVALRFWVRFKVIRQPGWDDYCIIGAWMILFVEMMVIIPEVRYGAGRHSQYIVPASNIVEGLHLNFATQPLCLIALCLTKVSVGLFLLRLTPSIRYARFIWGTVVFTILSAVGNFLTVFFQCQPLAFTWDTSIPGGSCIAAGNLKFAAFFNSSVSVLTDLIFALLPIPMLWRVQMNWKIKAAVAAALSLGIFATVAALVKISYLSSYGKHGDFLFDSTDLTIWTTIEICTAIIAASIPCLKPMFRSMLSGSSYAHAKYDIRATGHYIRQQSARRDGTSPSIRNDFEMLRTTAISRSDARPDDKLWPSNTSIESFPDKAEASGFGIMRTTMISVSVEEQGLDKEVE